MGETSNQGFNFNGCIMNLSIELFFGIIGTITGVTSLVVSAYFNKKAIEQTDKNLKSQLLYQDRKQALMNLQKIIDESENLYTLKQNLEVFSNSFERIYVPKGVLENIKSKLYGVEEFYDENTPYPSDHMSDEKYDDYLNSIPDDPYENMDHIERFDYDLKAKLNHFRISMKQIIDNNLKEV